MLWKDITLVAGVTVALAAAVPAQAQTLQAGATPTGVPFTFLDTKTNSIQGVVVDLVQCDRQGSEPLDRECAACPSARLSRL